LVTVPVHPPVDELVDVAVAVAVVAVVAVDFPVLLLEDERPVLLEEAVVRPVLLEVAVGPDVEVDVVDVVLAFTWHVPTVG
jgi:hypothetical protein